MGGPNIYIHLGMGYPFSCNFGDPASGSLNLQGILDFYKGVAIIFVNIGLRVPIFTDYEDEGANFHVILRTRGPFKD